MTNHEMINREIINNLLVGLFNQILDIEMRYMLSKGFKDLTINELHLIDAISSCGNPTMTNVADAATLTNGTITTAIKKLETKNYVKRSDDPYDRRIKRVSLTNSGIKASIIHNKFHEEMIDWLIGDTDILQNDILVESLQRLGYFFEDIKEKL